AIGGVVNLRAGRDAADRELEGIVVKSTRNAEGGLLDEAKASLAIGGTGRGSFEVVLGQRSVSERRCGKSRTRQQVVAEVAVVEHLDGEDVLPRYEQVVIIAEVETLGGKCQRVVALAEGVGLPSGRSRGVGRGDFGAVE